MSQNSPLGGHRARQALFWIVKILISSGLLYVLLTRVDLSRLWALARTASLAWLAAALLLYLAMVLVSCWRWGMLLDAQHVRVPFGALTSSFLVATFFNNFLPSNIGGDVVRIRDTAPQTGSKTLATTVVLVDRGVGLLGLVFIAALGATAAARMSDSIGPVGPGLLWAVLAAGILIATFAVVMPHGVARLLGPLRILHQEWVEERIGRLTTALGKFRDAPQSLLGSVLASVIVQGILVLFYAAIAWALHLDVPLAHLAIVVPMTSIVQMLPVSVNGFGVREATFAFYFTKLGEPLEAALALSFIGAALVMLFSTSGAVVYLTRSQRPTAGRLAQTPR